MPLRQRSLRHIPIVAVCIYAVCILAISTEVKAEPVLTGAVKSGVRTAIDRAESKSLFSPPTLEQRIEAGIIFLRSEGYYGAQIEIVEENTPSTGSDNRGLLITIDNDQRKLFIKPGVQFKFGNSVLSLDGPKSDIFEDVRSRVTKITSEFDKEPARAADVLRIQSQALVAIKDAGFTQAEDQYPEIVVDHATGIMSVTYTIRSGPLTTLGGINVAGANLTPESWVVKTAAVRPGDVATGDRIRKIAERFRLTGAYQNVDLSLAAVQPVDSASAVADLTLILQERATRTWSAGAVLSSTDGFGIDASTSFFHRLHMADTLTLAGRLGTLESSLGANLRLPSFRGPSRDLFLEARAGQETTDSFTRLIARIGANYTIPRGRKDLLTYGLGIDVTRTRTPADIVQTRDDRYVNGSDLSLLVRYERDRADDILNPTRGWRAQGEIQPSVFFGDGQTIPYGRLVLAGSIYRPFEALPKGVIAARVKAGVLLTGDNLLPFDRRFFAGGGGSVRGYAFQSIGPRDSNDNPLGGRSVVEGSVEARWSLRGPFGIALFADAARVGSLQNNDEQQTKIGIGVGLRYNLGLAPLRVDLAVPLNRREGDPPVQIYLSAGQSF